MVRVYFYRWIVLGVLSLVNLTIQMLWIGYTPITHDAATTGDYCGDAEIQRARSMSVRLRPFSWDKTIHTPFQTDAMQNVLFVAPSIDVIASAITSARAAA